MTGGTKALAYASHAADIALAMGRFALRLEPRGIVNGARAARHLGRELAARARGEAGPCVCPICGWSGPRFGPIYYFDAYRENIRCYACGSTDRDRLVKLYMAGALAPFFAAERRRVLDIGPLRYSRGFFPDDADYLSFDLVAPHAMVRGDLCAAPFPDASFDAWLCFHVLDLIPDDTKAMQELFRITKPGGLGLLDHVMRWGLPTEEYGAPRARECGHRRRYGDDLLDRLRDIGFAVRVVDTEEAFPEDVRRRHGIHGRRFLVCERPATKT